MLNFRSVTDLNHQIMANIHRLDRSQFDVVVGVPRSGMLPATILATQLQLPLSDIHGFANGWVYCRSGRPSTFDKLRVLLVDDTVNHGAAMANAVKTIQKRSRSITRFCVFGPYRGIEGLVDIFCETVSGPRAFEWNMAKHARLPRWGFDIDGALCREPLKEENDDGQRYIQFIRNAEPLFLPKRPVGHIVTGRLEKYRTETMSWLARHNIRYHALHMMKYATKRERIDAMHNGGRGLWKAEIVKKAGTEFFIESCPKQARVIASEAGIPVWCTGTQSLATV